MDDERLPPDPGTSPIPEGHVRLWHYTPLPNVPSIREHGLRREYARGDAGNGDLTDPSAGMWASTCPPDHLNHSEGHAAVVEFHAHPNEISGNAESPWHAELKREPGQSWEDRRYDPEKLREWNEGHHHVIMRGSVPPEHILAIHEPWHHAARYMRDDKAGLASYQWVKDEYAEGPHNAHLEPYVRGLRALENGQAHEASLLGHFEAAGVEDYGISHRPLRDGAPAHDLTEGYAEDIYTHPQYWAGGWPDKASAEGLRQLREARGKPDHMMTIYRASAPGTPYRINTGDWVTLSPTYAGTHAYNEGPGDDWHVHKAVVPARHVRDAGTDQYREQGYWGPDIDSEHHSGPRGIQAQASSPEEYGISHRPDETGPPLHDMLEGDMMPRDFYDRMHEYDTYSHDRGLFGEASYQAQRKMRLFRGKPDKMVTIWRSAPAVNPESRNAKRGEINNGDWVGLSRHKALAESYEANDPPSGSLPANHPRRYHIWSARVPAKHVRNAAGDLTEWGYFGPDVKDILHHSEQCSHRARVKPPEDRIETEGVVQHFASNETAPEGHQVWAVPAEGRSPVAAEVFHNMTTREPGEHGENWYQGISYHGPYHVIRHPQTRQVWLVDRHGRDASPTGGHYGNPEHDGNWGEHQAWEHQHGLESAGPEAHRFGTFQEPRLNLMNERTPEFPHTRVDPEDEERVRRPEPRAHAPQGVSPSEEYHGSYEVVRHPETGRFHVIDNAGRSADVLPLNGFDTQLKAERSRDYIEKRRQGKERAKGIAEAWWAAGHEALDPGGTDESRRSEDNMQTASELMDRYHGGLGEIKFDSDEEGGAPYYEREHLIGTHPSGWYAKHYGGAHANVFHRATGDESHDLIHLPQHPEDDGIKMIPRIHPDFGDDHLAGALADWHDRPDGMREHLETTNPEYDRNARAIQRWKRRHLGVAVVAHFEEDGEEAPRRSELLPEPSPAELPQHMREKHGFLTERPGGMDTDLWAAHLAGRHFNDHLGYHVFGEDEHHHGAANAQGEPTARMHGRDVPAGEMIAHMTGAHHATPEFMDEFTYDRDEPHWHPGVLEEGHASLHAEEDGGSDDFEYGDAAEKPRPGHDGTPAAPAPRRPKVSEPPWRGTGVPPAEHFNAMLEHLYAHGVPRDMAPQGVAEAFRQHHGRDLADPPAGREPAPGDNGQRAQRWRTRQSAHLEDLAQGVRLLHRNFLHGGDESRPSADLENGQPPHTHGGGGASAFMRKGAAEVVAHFEGHEPRPLGSGPHMQQKLFHMQPDPTLNAPESGRHNPADPEAHLHWRSEHDEDYQPRECPHCGGDLKFREQHAEDHDAWLHEQDWHTDWDEDAPGEGEPIHRGMATMLPQALHDRVHDSSVPVAQRASELANHIISSGGVGNFWSSEPDVSKSYAESTVHHLRHRYPKPNGEAHFQTPVMLHAKFPGMEHVETDPDELRHWGVFSYHLPTNREVPIKREAPVHITGVSWADPGHGGRPSYDGPEHAAGTESLAADPHWTHHEFGGEGIQANASLAVEAVMMPSPDRLSPAEERSDRWHEYKNRGSGHLHRGIFVRLPEDLHHFVHDESQPRAERAEALRRHFADSGEGLGMHWTPHPQIAQRATWNAASGDESGHGAYAGEHGGLDYDDEYGEDHRGGWNDDEKGPGSPYTEVMFHATTGERNRLRNREELERHGIGWAHSQDEDEFPVKPGSPMRLHGISWKQHEPGYPNEPFEHHDFDRPHRHVSSLVPVVAHFDDDENHEDDGTDHCGLDNPHRPHDFCRGTTLDEYNAGEPGFCGNTLAHDWHGNCPGLEHDLSPDEFRATPGETRDPVFGAKALPGMVAHFGDDEDYEDDEPQADLEPAGRERDEHDFVWDMVRDRDSGERFPEPDREPRCLNCSSHAGAEERHMPEDGHRYPQVQQRLDREQARQDRWDRGEYDRTRYCGVQCEMSHAEDRAHGIGVHHTFAEGEPEHDQPRILHGEMPQLSGPFEEPTGRSSGRYEVRSPSAEHRCHYCRSVLPQYRKQASLEATATRNHWDMTEEGMRLHLRDEHGIADPEDPAAVHWDKHSGDIQPHVHPDLEREFVQAANPGFHAGDAFVMSHGEGSGPIDPVFGARGAVTPVAFCDTVAAPPGPFAVIEDAAARLGSWEPETAAEAARAAREVPLILEGLCDGLAHVAGALEEMPLHPEVRDALADLVTAAARAAHDAAELVHGLPPEASCEDPPGSSPNR